MLTWIVQEVTLLCHQIDYLLHLLQEHVCMVICKYEYVQVLRTYWRTFDIRMTNVWRTFVTFDVRSFFTIFHMTPLICSRFYLMIWKPVKNPTFSFLKQASTLLRSWDNLISILTKKTKLMQKKIKMFLHSSCSYKVFCSQISKIYLKYLANLFQNCF